MFMLTDALQIGHIRRIAGCTRSATLSKCVTKIARFASLTVIALIIKLEDVKISWKRLF